MQSESRKCDLDKIKVRALPEHLDARYRGEIEEMYFRELDEANDTKNERGVKRA